MNEFVMVGFLLTEFFFDDGHLVGGYEIRIALDAGSLRKERR